MPSSDSPSPGASTTRSTQGEDRLGPPYKLIRKQLAKGRIIPFIGSGASLLGRHPSDVWKGPECDFLPKAGELANYLDEISDYPSNESMELTRVAQYYDEVAGPGGLDEELHDVFSRPYAPSRLHWWLASLDVKVIITTNYDNLLERAFRERNRPFHRVIYHTEDQAKLQVWRHGAAKPENIDATAITFDPEEKIPIIYKMHGNAELGSPDKDSYVITEDDYVEFLTRMVGHTAVPAGLGEPMRSSHFLFLGYGLRDWNLRVILHKIWRDWPRRYASWAIQQQANRLEAAFWEKKGLLIFELTIDKFLDELAESGGTA